MEKFQELDDEVQAVMCGSAEGWFSGCRHGYTKGGFWTFGYNSNLNHAALNCHHESLGVPAFRQIMQI